MLPVYPIKLRLILSQSTVFMLMYTFHCMPVKIRDTTLTDYFKLVCICSSAGKATVITIGGLVVGAAVGSVVENWLQVDIVPFFGIHSPAVIVSEFILFSQFLVSLYLR